MVIEGGKYSHVVDPRSGYPQTAAASGTAIAPDVLEAGALAKALIILSPEEADQLIDERGAPYAALVISRSGNGGLQLHPSRYFEHYRIQN